METSHDFEPCVAHAVEIVVDRVAFGSKAVFHPVLREVRLDSRGGELGMEAREDETAAPLQNREGLEEESPKISEVFGYKRAKDGVAMAAPHREVLVEVRLSEGNLRISPPSHPKHAAGEIETHRSGTRSRERRQVDACTAAGVEDSLTVARVQGVQGVPPIQSDKRVRSLVVELRPTIVSTSNARSFDPHRPVPLAPAKGGLVGWDLVNLARLSEWAECDACSNGFPVLTRATIGEQTCLP
jgi:hypothetical protein